MVRLHAELGASGLEILAFPCNQFGNQEPQAARDVEARIRKRYGVAFHVMAKVDVNGPNSHAVFRYLKHKTPKVPLISWNFGVYYVVGRDGCTLIQEQTLNCAWPAPKSQKNTPETRS